MQVGKLENLYYWQKSGVPREFVDRLSSLRTETSMKIINDLYRILIERTNPRIRAHYTCYNCGKTKTPDRCSEEVGTFCDYCHRCTNMRVRYDQSQSSLRNFHYHDGESFCEAVTDKIIYLADRYGLMTGGFKLTCGFHENGYYAQFSMGEMAYGHHPVMTVVKAAILWPIAWDMDYCWTEVGVDSKPLEWQQVLAAFYGI